IDPTSPGFGNRTKSAELADYKQGRPGSNQLAVQGHRTIAKAKRHPGLAALLNHHGCTLERAADRLAACLNAQLRRASVTKDGKVVVYEIGDDYPVQLNAAKAVFQLQSVFDSSSDQHLPDIE